MSEKTFKFISPGYQFQEIDNSQRPAETEEIGPVIIGRAQRGPAMKPIFVSSFSEFIGIFGNPTPTSDYGDVWRDNVVLGPAYGVLAAQASLKNKNALTYIRLLGTEHPEATTTNGGKAGWKTGAVAATGSGGAYGLFVFPSSSNTTVTGTLAAVWYLKTGSIQLSGSRYGNASATTEGTGTSELYVGPSKEFRVLIKDENNVNTDDIRFNFTPTSDKFARKVFNTNPTKLNSTVYTTTKNYFLGETFEDFINNDLDLSGLQGATDWVGVILGLKNGSTSDELANRQLPAQNSKTGWFFAQDVGAAAVFQAGSAQKLFKFHSLDSGEWNQSNIKISIRNIKVSPNDFDRFGTFDVLVRSMNDADNALIILEQFTNCNLNPKSDNYIAKKIGDKYVQYNTTLEKNEEIGEYNNQSNFIRVEVSEEVASEVIVPELLPFGVYGPVKFKNFSFASGSQFGDFTTFENPLTQYTSPFVLGSNDIAQAVATGTQMTLFGVAGVGVIKTASVIFPGPRLRVSTTSGSLSSPKSAFFGVYTDDNSQKFSNGVKDLVRIMPSGVDSFTPASSEGTDYSFIFTLDDVKPESNDAKWVSGSRVAGTSITALTGTYSSILNQGFNAFTTFLAGGFDGFDIREIEPFRNSGLSSVTAKTSYAYNSLQRAIEMLRNPEEVQFNVAAVPGVNNSGLTSRLIDVCEERGDALAIIDLENDFTPRAESTSDLASRRPVVSTAISSLKSRGINSSYGAAYFPWVQIREPISNNLTYVPPSVPVLGAIAYNDKVQAPWWAIAGFNRGSLSDGHGGIPVINVTQKLTKDDRDKLYAANINPIAVIDNSIVIFGQKTLQVRPSALDRINVRRALLDIKKKISTLASQLLFEPNVEATWTRFKSKAEPILRDIVSKNGLEEFKLVLDSSTTTADLKDRNIVYGKLFLKPVKTAEYFGFDFNITDQGASFADL